MNSLAALHAREREHVVKDCLKRHGERASERARKRDQGRVKVATHASSVLTYTHPHIQIAVTYQKS